MLARIFWRLRSIFVCGASIDVGTLYSHDYFYPEVGDVEECGNWRPCRLHDWKKRGGE